MSEVDRPMEATIDARAPGLGVADLIFVFGTPLDEPARIAGDLFHQCLSPLVVTGGCARQLDGLYEADHHRDLLLAAGVPADSILVENRSSSTYENVLFALPLIEQRCPNPQSAIAVVKQNHRHALVTLAQLAPSIERIYAATYPSPTRPERIDKEIRYMSDLVAEGIDPLIADDGGGGWRRSAPA